MSVTTGAGADLEGHARTSWSVRGDANRAQILAAFPSLRTPRSKCVGPLGALFPSPIKIGPNRMTAVRLHRAVRDALIIQFRREGIWCT
jgi:hypothetical protein